MIDLDNIEPVVKLKRDIVKAVKTLHVDGGKGSKAEMRYLVDAYYQMQKYRIATENQIRSMGDTAEPHEILDWLSEQMRTMENQVKRALDAYGKATVPGRWLQSITGIGPVLAANLLGHLDVTKTETAGGFWRFAGLDPTLEWKKGEKRPFNAKLKTACWKAGESFCKVQNNENDVYGKVYAARKALEIERNDAGQFADQAKAKLEKFNIGKDTDAYKAYSQGKLPPAHIDQRAKRYAVKLFLAHLHHVMYVCEYNKEPPKPYIIEHGGHVHYIAPPNWPLEEV